MKKEMSFQVSLENDQGSSIPDGGGKFIPPARNSEWKRITVVQSWNDKGLDKKLCWMLFKEGPDLSDVVQCKPARSSSLCNVHSVWTNMNKQWTTVFLLIHKYNKCIVH